MALFVGPVHCSRDPQISFFIQTLIKNGSHSTIHTFKNHFATVFSVSTKISYIQTDPKVSWELGLLSGIAKISTWVRWAKVEKIFPRSHCPGKHGRSTKGVAPASDAARHGDMRGTLLPTRRCRVRLRPAKFLFYFIFFSWLMPTWLRLGLICAETG